MGESVKRGITATLSPAPDQIEVRLFGPGYGECAAVHLGENQWIIIDSCIDIKTWNPPVLDYFKAIDVTPNDAVNLIIISHWHDDHIRGLNKIVSACPKASICCSSVLTTKEFLAYLLNYRRVMLSSSGVNEIDQVLNKTSSVKNAMANRTVLKLPQKGVAESCIVTTLSPSDKEYNNFLQQIGTLIPSSKKIKKRAFPLKPKDTAVAIWIETGDVKILLGSDLEEKGDSESGWSAIVQSSERPQGRASIFKIPHHGSSTGHHDNVWSDMMINSPIALLSPFYLAGKVLPTDKDVGRINSLTPKSYITTKHQPSKSHTRRHPAVERTIRERVGKIRMVQPAMGWISLRNGGKSNPNLWTVDLSDSSCHLNDFQHE